MSIYGGSLCEEKSISIEEFSDLLVESDNQIESMFKRFNLLNEDGEQNKSTGTELALGNQFNKPIQIKKTIFSKIKELIVKFAKMCKEFFIKVAETIHKKYMETNFQDQWIKRYRNIMTFKNLEKAKENGWEGYSEADTVIGRPANVMDTDFYKDLSLMYDTSENITNLIFSRRSTGNKNLDLKGIGFSRIDPKEDIDPIIKSDSIEQSEEKYEKFKDKLKEFRSLSNSINNLTDSENDLLDPKYKGGEMPWFTYAKPEDENAKYPISPQLFVINCTFAQEGEKKIKEIRMAGKNVVKNFNMEKDLLLDNMKESDKAVDNELAKKFSLYYKAKYEYASAFIYRVKQSIMMALKIIKIQHKVAIAWYMKSVKIIKKYVKNPEQA